MFIRLFLVFITIFISNIFSFPQIEDLGCRRSLWGPSLGYAHQGEDMAKTYIDKGKGLLTAGKLDEAITTFEDALAFSPDSTEAKSGLVKALVEKGRKYSTKKNYDLAIQCLNKAKRFEPENNKLKKLYNSISEKRRLTKIKPRIIRKKVAPRPRAEIIKEIPLKVYEEKISTLEKEHQKTINKIKKQKKFILFLFFLSLSGGMVFVLLYLLKTKKEKVSLQNKPSPATSLISPEFGMAQDILKLLLSYQLPAEKIKIREMIISPNPHVRARGIELLAEEFVVNNEDSLVVVKILLPFLKDPNNRVKANTCLVLYRYNPDLSLPTLKEMLDTSDKWEQASACWALGEIGTAQTAEILLNRIDDLDKYALLRAIKSLKKTGFSSQIPDELRQKIESKLSQITQGQIELGERKEKEQVSLYLDKGLQLYNDKKYDEAILEFKTALQCNSQLWQAYEYSGSCYHKKNNLSSAINCYRKAILLNPKDQRLRDLLKSITSKEKQDKE